MTTPSIPHPPADLEQDVPPLEPGDRLTRAEFERRYEAMPYVKKAELIEGVVHMPSPTRLRRHGRPHGHMTTWVGVYEAATPGVLMGDNTTARLDLANEPQPDVLLLIDPAKGGQARINADDYVLGAPELVAEVASSTVSIDMNVKKEVYRRNAVREYLVWRVRQGAVDWFTLRDEAFAQLPADAAGVVRSAAFPGLWLDVPALLRGELSAVLACLQQGLASAEHAAFVAQLNP